MHNQAQSIQLTPALTDFKGPTIFICYRRISVIAKKEILKKIFRGQIKKNLLLANYPLESDSTYIETGNLQVLLEGNAV